MRQGNEANCWWKRSKSSSIIRRFNSFETRYLKGKCHNYLTTVFSSTTLPKSQRTVPYFAHQNCITISTKRPRFSMTSRCTVWRIPYDTIQEKGRKISRHCPFKNAKPFCVTTGLQRQNSWVSFVTCRWDSFLFSGLWLATSQGLFQLI